MQHLGAEDELKQVFRDLWATMSPKERLQVLSPEERRRLLARLPLEERLQGLTLEQRLQGLTPEGLEQVRKLLQVRKDKKTRATPPRPK
jgi:hypothetical protein